MKYISSLELGNQIRNSIENTIIRILLPKEDYIFKILLNNIRGFINLHKGNISLLIIILILKKNDIQLTLQFNNRTQSEVSSQLPKALPH